MADLKSGTTVGGQLVLTQDVFPLDVIGNSLKFKGSKVYTALEPPRADEVDAVSRINGGTFLKPVMVVGNLSIDSVSSPGSGLNLISGESAGEPNFGIFHGYTPDFGKHGAVQSNWATYFTNKGNANYGWIFKTSAGAVASVGSTGIITAPSYVSSDAAPTAPDQLTRKDYVDAVNTNLTNAVNLKVAKSGDVMTGPLTAPTFNGKLTGDVVGNISGNAGSATKLQTARMIGGVSFDGTANINLPGVNTAGNQSTSGNAATATKLATSRTLSWTGDATGSLSFDGTANATTPLTLANSGVTAGTYKSVTVDAKGRVTAGDDVITGLITSTAATGTANVATTNNNTFLNITEKTGSATSTIGSSSQITGAGTVTVASDAAGKITITGAQTITGNAASATKLATARTINGTSFDGTANITVADSTKLPLTGGTLSGNLAVKGTITATGNITAFSDARIKGDLIEIVDSLSKVQKLTGYTYTRTDLHDGLRYVGLIAQDVQAVIPEAVRECEDGTLSVDYMGLVGLLVQSIKELDKRIKDLEEA